MIDAFRARPAARKIAAVVVLALTWAAAAAADDPPPPPLRVGDTLHELTLQDQHGAQRVVDATARMILFSRDMDGGDVLKSALAELPSGTLDTAHVAYVSDISGMPGLIARLFAVPSMRRRPYPMLLDRTGEATAFLPDEPGLASLIYLDRLQITRIEHLAEPEVVRARVLALLEQEKEEDDAAAGGTSGPARSDDAGPEAGAAGGTR